MAENKTQPTKADPQTFLASIPDQGRRADARTVCDMLARITGEPAEMWGTAIVGFGRRRLRYDSGRELDSMEIGFSPRKAYTTIYVSGGRYRAGGARGTPHAIGRPRPRVSRLTRRDVEPADGCPISREDSP